MNTWKRKALLLVSVPALALPGAIGIYRWLLPARGMVGAASASIGIELAYLGVSILTLNSSHQRHAKVVAWCAAIVSIAMNILLDYSTRVAGGLDNTTALWHPLTCWRCSLRRWTASPLRRWRWLVLPCSIAFRRVSSIHKRLWKIQRGLWKIHKPYGRLKLKQSCRIWRRKWMHSLPQARWKIRVPIAVPSYPTGNP